jgi:CheY-like chemotaxis protein
MSHELRTPLNAVLGMATVLESSYLDPLQRSCVTTIRNGGEALLAQIREILEHVRIEAGRTTLEPQVFDLCLCLQECADLVAAAAAARHLDLAWTVTDDCPRVVETDPARLRQVLVNLLSNAVSATARGEVVLSASHQWTGADEVELAFEVRDTGTGIAAEEVPLLFQPFGQVGRDPARRRSGTGLGLAIARRLSELMGGTITVESDVGRGSLFRCTIHARAAATAPVARETRSAPLAGKRLLVVDDNPTYRKLLGHLVRAWGCDVRFASSAPEAEAALADAGSRDAVLLDHHLGGEVEGPELAARLRRRLDGACPPLVLLTCVGHGADAELARPFAGVVTKPVRPAQLREVLQRLFERPAAPAAPELAGTASSWRPALRILVVEDNPVNQQVALLLLEQMGLKADVVGNGIEAVQSLERHPYDVVFMDVLMPEMDGLEASRRIRRHHAGQPGPRIVAMTAYALEGDRERCLAAGMDDFLSKPITLEDLKRVLDPALQPHAR